MESDEDTAEELGSTLVAEEEALPESEASDTAPETEESAPKPLSLDDPEVVELLKGERAKLEESYRRKEEHSRRQAQLQEYERAREAAYNFQVKAVHGKVQEMLKEALEDGKEPDSKALEDLLTQTSASGLIETVESMETWVNGFLQDDNPVFFKAVAENEELNRAWIDAKTSRRPDRLFTAAMKVAAASGEARGYIAGQKAALDALKARETEQKKTQQIREASSNRNAEASPMIGIAGQAPRRMTLQQIDDMPMREWQEIPQEERAKILEEAHRARVR